ncbi:MAG: RyR domain-containing protein [Vicinamibacterales bacterium]
MTYQPRPIDTSAVALDDDLVALTETLARHVHDVWAAERLRLGWTWGPVRDDAARRHPGLVPYDELSESERAFDRATAMETLRAIIARGYRITPPAPRSRRS